MKAATKTELDNKANDYIAQASPEIAAFLAQFVRSTYYVPTEEEKDALKAVFGIGTQVVNVVTGQVSRA
jgi:hypothetical protein